MPYAHATPSCCTFNTRPAMFIVPVRALPGFELMATRTEPLPDPRAPETTTIQGTLLLAAHVHPASAVTSIVTCSPAALAETSVRDTPKPQVGAGEGSGVGAGEGVVGGAGVGAMAAA